MVFGYYHIKLRTIERGTIPEVDNIPGAIISEKVKVGHMLWIPFFPMGKVWVMEHQGNMYNLNPQAIQAINQKHGRSSNPWYTFLGLILIPVLMGLFSFNSFMNNRASKKRNAEYFANTLAANLDKVGNATKADIFIFKNGSYKKTAAKVNFTSKDSIYFLAPIDNMDKKWDGKNWAAGYFASGNATQEVAFAREDLKKTFAQSPNESMYKKGIPAGKLPVSGLIQLDKVITVAEGDKIPVISEAEIEQVKLDFSHFVQNANNLDSFLNLIDENSHKYYENILTLATKKDEEMVEFVKSSKKQQNCTYELLLYTKYMYLNTVKDRIQVDAVTLENKKDYLFFLKLLDRGFLTLDGPQISDVFLKNVSIPEKNVALLALSSPSNMLQQKVKIPYQITMRKENNRWKIDLPSTYSYTENQIVKTFNFSSASAKEYRSMIRDNVAKVAADDAYIGNAWMY